jgi:hypothetical protein
MTALLAVLALLVPVVVHDSREASPLTSVGPRAGTVASDPIVYERVSGHWRQWWLLFAHNDQDRGIVRPALGSQDDP